MSRVKSSLLIRIHRILWLRVLSYDSRLGNAMRLTAVLAKIGTVCSTHSLPQMVLPSEVSFKRVHIEAFTFLSP